MTTPDPDLQLVTVFEGDDRVAFSLAQATLEDAGIEFAATEENLAGYGFTPMLNPACRIQVAEPFESRALELIRGLSGPIESDDGEHISERE